MTTLVERVRGRAPRASADSDSVSSSPPAGFDRRLIVPMILGSILNPVNSSMLAVALIPIGRAFGAAPSQTAWLVSGLYLATAVGQPVIGRLVDAFGPRPLYLGGTALVGVAGALGVWAPTLGVLIVSRVLLGFGTSAAYPASMWLLRSEADRTGMKSPSGILAALSISNQVIAVIGPTLGGLLIAAGGWHLIFAINLPLSAACLVLGTLRLPRRKGLTDAQRIDVVGILLFAAMLTAFLLFVMNPGVDHLYLVALALIAAGAFTWRELGTAQPFIDLRVLSGNTPLLATYARQVLTYTTSYSFLYGFTQWLEEGRSLSASGAGVVLLPMSATAIVVTAVTGRNARVRAKLLVGSVAQIMGCALLLTLGSGSAIWAIVLIGAVIGIPQGLIGLANQNALYAQADPERMGSSAGLLRTFMYLGALLASAANAAFYRDGATTGGLHQLASLLVVVAVLFLVVTLLDRSLSRIGRETE
ncbi:MFS transporter [Catenulispora yoronensis]|uniref:MFS transporter n=1 Tax=Catenulispora yoronensis TaxID=450799 RepID=A0ABP5G960_9ACTN